ncbi:MAG: TolC family protein [Pseudomonadota bacterium]|nr:TolC family protein [Pseudomonadota bacterium]
MNFLTKIKRRRASAWFAAIVLLCPPGASALTLAEAEQMALQQQPQLAALEARIRAAQSRAISAAQLPDPMLTAGVSNLPLEGEERYSLTQDFMTMTSVGIAQEFPRAEKRHLRSKAESLGAEELQWQLGVVQRTIQRETAMAWLTLWSAEHAMALLEAQISEAGRERDAANIALRSNRATQADALTASIAVELLQDRREQLVQDAAVAREQLKRWTGAGVGEALPDAPPALPSPVDLSQLLAALKDHPELKVALVDIAARENEVELARADYKADWRVELMYANRPDFSDMASLQFGIDLPLFSNKRQAPQLASATDELAAVEAMHQDHHRMLSAETAAAWRSWSQSQTRLQRYDETILPAAQARADAALTTYKSGRSELAGVLDARRAVLDVQLMRLELLTDSLRQLIALRYFSVAGASP